MVGCHGRSLIREREGDRGVASRRWMRGKPSRIRSCSRSHPRVRRSLRNWATISGVPQLRRKGSP